MKYSGGVFSGMRWQAVPFGFVTAAGLLLAWVGFAAALGVRDPWVLARVWQPGELYYANWDFGQATSALGAMLCLATLGGALFLRREWLADGLALGSVLFSIQWWLAHWLLEDAYNVGLGLVMLASFVVPWWIRGGVAAGASALPLAPMMMGMWGVFYAPIGWVFGHGPTAPRPVTIVLFGLLMTGLFIAMSGAILRFGRRLGHLGRGVHTLLLASLLVWQAGDNFRGLSIYSLGWVLPVLAWAGAVSLMVRGDVKPVQWMVWGPCALLGAWALIVVWL